jgi:hypothetical protein
MPSLVTESPHVIPTEYQLKKTIQAFSEKLDVADQYSAGIAELIYQMGMRLGSGKPIVNVNAFCIQLEKETPKRQWNKSRRSECRTLFRRYWSIKDAQTLLQQANKSASYSDILSVFRLASKKKLTLKDAVSKYEDVKHRHVHLNQFLSEVQGIAGRAGLSLINDYEQEGNVVLVLRRVLKRSKKSSG